MGRWWARSAVRWTLVSVIAPAARGAEAQTPELAFGAQGHFAISGERMFGFVHATQTNGTGSGSKTTNDAISLLGTPLNAAASIYTFPRAAFDVFVAPSISAGASLSYFHVSQSSTFTGSATLANNNSVAGYALAPRVGVAASLGPQIAIWLRAGITYVNLSSNSTFGVTSNTTSTHLIAVTLEVPFEVTIAPRVMLSIGPTADLGVSGSQKSSSGINSDVKETDYGLQAGLLFFL